MTETIKLDLKSKTQLYIVYNKPTLQDDLKV